MTVTGTRTAAVYLRVSTDRQTVENQRAPLAAACVARQLEPTFYEETESAAKKRPVFESMLAAACAGQHGAVVVAALDRLGRSLRGVLDTVAQLDAAGVRVVSLREPWLDTSGPHRSLLVAIFGWVAEMERGVLIDRVNAGLARARRQGKRLGRKPLSEKHPEKYRALVTAANEVQAGALSPAAAARKHKVAERTLRRFLAPIFPKEAGHGDALLKGSGPAGVVSRPGAVAPAKTPAPVSPSADVPPQG